MRGNTPKSRHEALSNGLCVEGEALGLGEGEDGVAEVGEAVAREVLEGGLLDEVVGAQAAEHLGALAGGQDVVGAAGVVAGGDGGVGAEEDAAGVGDAGKVSEGSSGG